MLPIDLFIQNQQDIVLEKLYKVQKVSLDVSVEIEGKHGV
jgi:hypothetical protein